MDRIQDIIANNLIYLRKSTGLTQLEFGQKFDYSDKTVSKWEQGNIVPSIETLVKIAEFCGVSLDYIVTKHNTKQQYDSIAAKTVNYANKITIIALANVVLLCIVVTIYVASIYNTGTANPSINRWWCSFLWFLPASLFLSAYMCKRSFHSINAPVILTSCGTWAVLAAAFITFLNHNNYWYLFIIGVPVQAALILIGQLKKQKD